jgi:hypothetical protein
MAQKQGVRPIHKLVVWLRILTICAVLASFIEIGVAATGSGAIELTVNDAPWVRSLASLSLRDRLIILAILSLNTIPWFCVLFQFWRLGGLYRVGKYFTPRNATYFRYMGVGLIVMSITDVVCYVGITVYLVWQDILSYAPFSAAMPMQDVLYMFDVDMLVAGLFLWTLARIMEIAAEMKEDADLTI